MRLLIGDILSQHLSTSKPLGAFLTSAAAASPNFDLAALLAAIKQWILTNADPRRLVDTPEERAAIVKDALVAFDRLVKPITVAKLGDVVAAAVLAAIEPQLARLIDILLTALAATLPPTPVVVPEPAPVVAPQGSAP